MMRNIIQSKAVLLGNNIDIYEMQRYDYEMTEVCVDDMVSKGYSMIVGDTGTWEWAQKKGISSILITNGTESMHDAYKKAVEVCEYVYKEREKNELLSFIVENSEEVIEIKDEEGNVLYNSFGESKELLKVKECAYKAYEEGCFSDKEVFAVYSDDKCWCANVVKLDKGSDKYSIALSIKRNYIEDKGISEAISIIYDNYVMGFENVLLQGDSDVSKEIAEQIEYFSKIDIPVLLVGESGVGRRGIAKELHRRGDFSQFVLMEVDCKEITYDEVVRVFDNLNGAIREVRCATIFFNNINYLDMESQKKIYEFIHMPKNQKKYRVISSSCQNLKERVENKEFYGKLYNYISELRIFIPPLRERQNDIHVLIGLYISSFNMKYGKQMVGVESAGIEELKKFFWPGNFNQFKRVLLQLLLCSEKAFVTEKSVRFALEQEDLNIENFGKLQIEKNETLEEIEKKIIQFVLEEEGMNQSKASKRLGIGRSTMWRKIK